MYLRKKMLKKIQIEFDAKQTLHQLDLAKKDMNKIARKMMNKVFLAVKKDAKSKMKGGVLNKVSGNLMKSIKYRSWADFTGYIKAGSKYATSHEYGATILPKKGEFLTFKNAEGEFKKVRQIVLKERKFLFPSFQDYWQSSKAEKIMDDVLDQALKEIFQEGAN
jgi:hypothetical protein